MNKKLKLNNKGFAVSVILYTAVTLVVLILLLIISILSTSSNNKKTLVDDIKEEVSGAENKKPESLGELTVTSSDGILSGEWHIADVTLTVNKTEQNGTSESFPLTYYYGTSSTNVNTQLGSNNSVTLSTNTAGTIYYFRACRGSTKYVCSKVASYLLRMDKAKPVIAATGGSNTWSASKTFTITPTTISGIAYYEYFVSDTTIPPAENSEIKNFTGNSIIINEPGLYIYLRGVNNAGVRGDWARYDLYVN